MKIITNCMILAVTLMVSFVARGEMSVKSRHIGGRAVAIDGQLGEWSRFGERKRTVDFTVLGESAILRGHDSWQNDMDLRAEFAFVHDDKALYVAIRINDQDLVRSKRLQLTEDHVEIWFGLPVEGQTQGKLVGIGLFANPDENRVTVLSLGTKSQRAARKIKGIQSAIAGVNSFYTIEVLIPLELLQSEDMAFADMRAGIYVVDTDSKQSAGAQTVLGTAPEKARQSTRFLPRIDQINLRSRLKIDYLLEKNSG